MKAFARISDEPILVHSQVYHPDYVIVMAANLMKTVDITEGIKKDGFVLMNTPKEPKEVGLGGCRVATVDATEIAIDLGLLVAGSPVVNTAVLGAFAKATGEIGLDSTLESIRNVWHGVAGERNAKAATLAYERVSEGS